MSRNRTLSPCYHRLTRATGAAIMAAKIILGCLLFCLLAPAGCSRAGQRRPSPAAERSGVATMAATTAASATARDPVMPFIGTLVSRSGTTLTIRNPIGLFTLSVQPDTIIDGATSGPHYARLRDHDLQRLKPGQALTGAARHRSDGSLVATAININAQLWQNAVVVATGSGYLDVHLGHGPFGDEFAPETTRLMLAPQAVIAQFGPLGSGTRVSVWQIHPGEYIAFDGAQADDGSVVIYDLDLLRTGLPSGAPTLPWARFPARATRARSSSSSGTRPPTWP